MAQGGVGRFVIEGDEPSKGGRFVIDEDAPTTLGGTAAEFGKGILRGASDVALGVGEAGAKTLLGPILGEEATKGLKALAAPSRSLVEAKAENPTEQFSGTAGEIAGGAAIGGGARSLGAAGLTALAAAGGATGEQVGGPWGRLAGALLPTLMGVGIPATVKGMIRGGEAGREAMADRINTFKQAGIESPSVGQATGGRTLQATESAASRLPGSAGVMAKSAEEEAAGMGRRIDEIAGTLSPNASGYKAGLTIEKGIKDFVNRFKGEQGFLYDKLDQYLPKDRPVSMKNTLKAMEDLNADIPGAPATSKFFKNSTIQALEGAMKSDAPQLPGFSLGTLPYEAMKKVRTLVGNEMENSNLLSQVPRSKWKALYGALSRDMEQAAKEAGPEAQKAFSRANAFSSAGYGRIENVLDRVAGKDTVEKMFTAAVSPSELKEGASTINAVMRSLKPEEQNVVKAAFIKRMGNALPNAQDEAGQVFSSQTFLTNWNKISPEAKKILFSRGPNTSEVGPQAPEQLRKNLDQIAKAASMIKEGSKVFANPSGTAQSVANIGGAASIGTAIATGNAPVALTLLGGMAGANLTAKLLTNPKFVNWLASSTKASPALLPMQVSSLAQSVMKMKDGEEKDELRNYLSAVIRQRAGMDTPQQTAQGR